MKSATEVFKTALYNEVKANAFYAKAAEITKNDESRMLFLQLGDMEDDHARMLVKKVGGLPMVQGFNAETYLEGLEANAHAVIDEKEMAVLNTGSMAEILQLAVELENKAQDTYHSLAEKTTDAAARDFCLELAAVEEKHATSLKNLLNSLTMDSEDRPGL
ncbi:MAG: ferritin family protein [Magnetococcales bacterium]|nr:ferritin family protein [Magnetococcales bacterium]NGZ27998.1 ferritin family protein [Magnetococcales bacterium]